MDLDVTRPDIVRTSPKIGKNWPGLPGPRQHALLARDEAVRAGRTITRIAVAFEAGRDGFWLARWLEAHGVEAHVIHPFSGTDGSNPVPSSGESDELSLRAAVPDRWAPTERLRTAALLLVPHSPVRFER